MSLRRLVLEIQSSLNTANHTQKPNTGRSQRLCSNIQQTNFSMNTKNSDPSQGTHVQKLRRVRSADGMRSELAPDAHLAIDRLAKGKSREKFEQKEEERLRAMNDPADWFKDLSLSDTKDLVQELKEATEALKEFSLPRSNYAIRSVDKSDKMLAEVLQHLRELQDRSVRYEDLYGMGFTDHDIADFDLYPEHKKELQRILKIDPNVERHIDKIRAHARKLEYNPAYAKDQQKVAAVTVGLEDEEEVDAASEDLELYDLDDGEMGPVWKVARGSNGPSV